MQVCDISPEMHNSWVTQHCRLLAATSAILFSNDRVKSRCSISVLWL